MVLSFFQNFHLEELAEEAVDEIDDLLEDNDAFPRDCGCCCCKVDLLA